MKRSFLFLQGPNSPFFAILGEELLDNGHRVLRLNFNSGDSFFWNGENTAEFKHPMSEFKTYLNNVARLRKITDMVIYNDSTPLNKQAIEALKHLKIRLHVFGDGTFSDNWITLEERIFGDKAVFPKDPKFYLRNVDENLPRERKFANNGRARALFALQYQLSGLFAKAGNRNSGNPLDYIRAKTWQFFIKLKQDKTKAKLGKVKYFLVDYELAKKSSIMRSFAAHAGDKDHLVYFSKKPISSLQLTKTNDAAAKYKLVDRVIVVENANFKQLVRNAKAYITTGSMDGLIAIKYGKPVLALGSAIYNLDGLTNQCQLNDFWNGHQEPEAEIYRKFRNYVITKNQISGSFYHKKGMKLALVSSLRRILGHEYASQSISSFDVS